MKNGDISNTAGYTIGFRCIGFLIKLKEEKLTDKVLNKLVGKYNRAEIDEKVRSTMEYIYRNTEYNVDLIIEEKDYTDELKEILDDLPFNRVVTIIKDTQITQRLLIGDLSVYVDDDTYRRGLINSKYAINFNELTNLIKRGGRI